MFDTAAQLVPPWTGEQLLLATEAWFEQYARILLDPEARNHRHTYISTDETTGLWTIAQVLVDPEGLNEWQAVFTVDKALAREEGKPTLNLVSIGPIA
jgi:hypothetical protein